MTCVCSVAVGCRFYEGKTSEAACSVTNEQWSLMQKRMKECPFTVLPLHKEKSEPEGDDENCFLTMVAQAQMPQHVLLTPLLAYQQSQGNAVPHVVVTFYQELSPSKGICLMRVDILDGQVVSKNESMRLVSDLVNCYTHLPLYGHVNAMNRSSSDFDYDAFIKELEAHRSQPLDPAGSDVKQ